MGKPDYPEPPDPRETSAASTSTNVGTAIANAFMGNVNQTTPEGSLEYSQNGVYHWYDPYTGESYDIPTFTATQTYSPEQQAIYDQSKGAQLNLATLANNQSGFLNDYMAEPFQYDPGIHENWAMGLYDELNGDRLSTQQEQLRSRLLNQGIDIGSDAYTDETRNLAKMQEDARNQFLLDSYRTGFGTALTERQEPINEITSLLSGSQVSQPAWINPQMPTIPTTDVAGNIWANYDAQVNQANAQAAYGQNLLGGLFGLGGAFLGNPAAF